MVGHFQGGQEGVQSLEGEVEGVGGWWWWGLGLGLGLVVLGLVLGLGLVLVLVLVGVVVVVVVVQRAAWRACSARTWGGVVGGMVGCDLVEVAGFWSLNVDDGFGLIVGALLLL
jgi:hypothetical protein